MNASSKLGIIAGGGAAPRELIAACRDMGRAFFVIALEGQADPDLYPDVELEFGAFGTLKRLCAQEKITEIVMLGRVRRPSVSEIRPDLLGLKVLAKIGLNSFGDDGLLRAVSKAIEEECGVRIVGSHEVFKNLLMPQGVLTKTAPDAQARKDIAQGIKVARALGALDIGQAVIVQHGVVLGVEAVEGTDDLIARAGRLVRKGGGGVLVKCVKPQQDSRFDLPTLGPSTIENLIAADLEGVAMESQKSLLLEREKTIALANEEGIFIEGFKESE
jgi:UDP-2,3-diacylglucosamine hydrolase